MNNRCWIIGNGPSLTPHQLEMIKGEPSIACNNIHLMYRFTEWRPTHYVRTEFFPEGSDPRLWYQSVVKHLLMGMPCYLHNFFADFAPELHQFKANNYKVISNCGHGEVNPDKWHLPMLCAFGGSVPVAMQVAELEGYDQLILLGCDMYPGHFNENYHSDEAKKYVYSDEKANDLLYQAHTIAKNYLDGRVINASPNSALNLYPKVDFEELIHEYELF